MREIIEKIINESKSATIKIFNESFSANDYNIKCLESGIEMRYKTSIRDGYFIPYTSIVTIRFEE